MFKTIHNWAGRTNDFKAGATPRIFASYTNNT